MMKRGKCMDIDATVSAGLVDSKNPWFIYLHYTPPHVSGHPGLAQQGYAGAKLNTRKSLGGSLILD
jgi:hypothetical protein